ncbi:MAG TPA: MFS transporter [Actinomycetota bacterium]|nr:MFS transporter [Actinomycetota bacterium]
MRSRNGILLAAVLGSGIVFLDSTVVNVALPAIGRDVDSSFFGVFEAQSYVYYGYLLTLSSLLILAGALADHHGRKRMFVIGLVGFGLTSVLCGLAPNMDLLIVGRILQGVAGAFLIPGSLALITTSFSGEEQGRAFGIWAGASGATAIFGPPLGGALVTVTSWRAVFLINVPLIAVALWATLKHVPESRDVHSRGTFDRFGALTIVVALAGLTFGTIRGQAEAWSTPVGPIALLVGAAALAAFVVLQRRVDNPLVPLDLFRSRNFTVTNISTFLIYGALYVSFQYLALHLIGTLGYNELGYGLGGLVGPLFLVLFSSRVGAVAARRGPRWFMTAGPALMGLGLLWLGRLPADSDPWVARTTDPSTWLPPRGYVVDVLPGMVLFGIGLVIMVAPLTTALMRSVPPAKSGVASAINNAISRIGPQLGGALLFVAATASFYGTLGNLAPAVDTASPVTRAELTPFNPPPDRSPPELRDVVARASTEAFQLTALVSAALCAAGAIVNGVGIRNDQLHDSDAVA